MANVTVYTKTVCPKCMFTKSMLEGNGIEFETINIDNNQEARDQLVAEGFMAVPIVKYNDKYYANSGDIQELIDELQ